MVPKEGGKAPKLNHPGYLACLLMLIYEFQAHAKILKNMRYLPLKSDNPLVRNILLEYCIILSFIKLIC